MADDDEERHRAERAAERERELDEWQDAAKWLELLYGGDDGEAH